LDAGCGIGSLVPLLHEAIGPKGHVTGVDIDPEFLGIARGRVEKAGLSPRTTFQTGDVNRLPFEDDVFDWAFSVDCVGYPAGGLSKGLRELTRVVASGGSVAILGWTQQRILPGHILLEDRLNATCSRAASYFRDRKPEEHFMRILHWFREVGLREPDVRTFLGEVRAPLSDGVCRAMISLMDMLWEDPPTGLTQEEMDEYRRLRRVDSDDFILDCPDYYAFFTYTMFYGIV
jgi:demethylmenaquinone methyltransferase/2-methoxy-6-polyprenyl-1,4-benzoquinol methylase